jgi:Zn-dependent peptidase ImmA (M78 family)/transcriptional regulator with XRE-family HTH domain
MDIGNRLKIARNVIGYTLEKASQESGIGQSSISEFENDKREPKFSQLSKLAEVYKKKIEFFLTDAPIINEVILWRSKPNSEEERKATEAEFSRLCEQYYNLEVLTGEVRKVRFPEPDVDKPEEFTFGQAESFARKVQNQFCLGDIPSSSIKRVLEERYYVKVFHLAFSGSAISTFSPEFGYAVLLNMDRTTKQWRRNFDLAHELFHLLTWNIFTTCRLQNTQPTEDEEKLANAFASQLLMPDDALRERIDLRKNEQGEIKLDHLDDIAREFGVSLDALVYRIANLFRIQKQDTEKYRDSAKKLAKFHKHRESENQETLPERYCDLALRALREGKLSLMQFAKYMGISYKKAQEYLMEEEDFTDEAIFISVD